MGCNYYAIPKATDDLKKKIIDAVNSNDFVLAKKMIPETIHIGKSSGGWKFCFNHNNWEHFEKSKASLEVFLLACEIYDEYDRQVTNDEFWEMVKAKEEGKGHLIWNGQECGTMEFGLNFSNSTEFS